LTDDNDTVSDTAILDTTGIPAIIIIIIIIVYLDLAVVKLD